MSIDRRRLDRLMPGLTPRGGILVLRSLKDGTQENPAWRLRMPPQQLAELI